MIKHFTKTLKRQFELILKFEWLLILEWSFKLWLLTLAIPLVTTVLVIVFSTLCGFKEFTLDFWRYYYYDGYICGFIAWRIHLGLLFMLFLYMINKVSEESFV